MGTSLKIYLKICRFSHIHGIPCIWVGIIPLKRKRRKKKEVMHRNLGETQGLRIEYKFIKILLSLNPKLVLQYKIF
ncbi:hypothetical protein [Caldisphaera sp.]|uniref:hypothetical protein n=1 Tax=Caldisphaera sp. TaxID=2060322 RepID=UPI003D123905